MTLQSAQNRESTVGKNSSKGGNVGVGIGAGSGGYGISVSAGVNAGKGHENGNGLTHAETTLDAGSNLKVTSGRDTRLTGAQASGEKVTVDVGRDLTLQSQ
ncbi:TPA: hemagglutinin repeat-containing protein, partial [Serratia marcescens]|nr:hemagglutinin repeat-containing protein [Serratia marcescens]